MGLLLKRTSKTRQNFTKDSRLVTKSFDLNDPSMTKKFSFCNITYTAKGNSVLPVLVKYKIDNENSWRAFSADANNIYSTGTSLKGTTNRVRTACFRFAKKSIGRKVSIKVMHDNSDQTARQFEIVDISFTFRGINRK